MCNIRIIIQFSAFNTSFRSAIRNQSRVLVSQPYLNQHLRINDEQKMRIFTRHIRYLPSLSHVSRLLLAEKLGIFLTFDGWAIEIAIRKLIKQ